MKRFLPYSLFMLFVLFLLFVMSLYKYAHEIGRNELQNEIIIAIERNETVVIGRLIIVKNVTRNSEVYTQNQKYLYNKIEYHK